MNVLSLFDGMSCGQLALQKAGIKYDYYFASEICKHAKTVTYANFPNAVQLGDVNDIYAKILPKIDLILAGCPCQSFSLAGRQLGFEDPRGNLFLEFARLLKECKPRYFLMENTLMSADNERRISETLGVEAVRINSSLLSAQNRDRLYWTNIPFGPIVDKGLILRDILLPEGDSRLENCFLSKKGLAYVDRLKGNQPRWKSYPNPLDGKAGCLTAVMSKGVPYGVIRELGRFLHPIECERLQTIPDDFSASVAKTNRYKMLGNGWTVDVIAHILKEIGI